MSQSEPKKLGVQFGNAAAADFEMGTWTFDMAGAANWKVAAGEFAIIPADEYRRLGALGGAPPDGWKLVPIEPTRQEPVLTVHIFLADGRREISVTPHVPAMALPLGDHAMYLGLAAPKSDGHLTPWQIAQNALADALAAAPAAPSLPESAPK